MRLEHLYPFPTQALKAELMKHPGAQIVWAQEEPENQGAWLMIREDLERALQPGQTLAHASRARSASTAAGYTSVHLIEQAAVIAAALGEKISRTVIAEQAEVTAGAQRYGLPPGKKCGSPWPGPWAPLP